MGHYSAAEMDAIRRDNRAMEAAGVSMVTELDAILQSIDDAAIGITAAAGDIDSLAKDGGHFAQDFDTTLGLTFGYKAGQLYNGKVVVATAAGTVLLTASTTNYVEVSRAGVVSKNLVGFSSGAVPLYQIVTGVAAITSVTNKKPLMHSLPNGGITGDMFSTAGRTKVQSHQLGTVSANASFKFIAPPHASKLSALYIAVDTTVNTDNTNFWTFALTNKGAGGAGTTVMLLATDVNTTKTTGGSAITANIPRVLTLVTPTGANELDCASRDVLVLTATKAAAAANLVGLLAQPEFTFDV
jgi:hypothetical protein